MEQEIIQLMHDYKAAEAVILSLAYDQDNYYKLTDLRSKVRRLHLTCEMLGNQIENRFRTTRFTGNKNDPKTLSN